MVKLLIYAYFKSRRSTVHNNFDRHAIIWKNYILHLNMNQATANRKTIEVIQ
jgi:hypothetical protein